MAAISVPGGSMLSLSSHRSVRAPLGGNSLSLSSHSRVCAPMRVTHNLRLLPQRNFLRISAATMDSLQDKSTGSEMVLHAYISSNPLPIPPNESTGSEMVLHAYISSNPLPIPPMNTSANKIPFIPVAIFAVKVLGNKFYGDVYKWLSRVFNKRTGTYKPLEENGIENIPTSTLSSSASQDTSAPLLGGECVLVDPIKEKTDFILPPDLQRGEIIAIGWRQMIPENVLTRLVYKWKNSYIVEPGRKVVFPRSVVTIHEYEDGISIMLKENQILGILETPNMEDIRPLTDRILIKICKVAPTYGGSFDNHIFGMVIAVGSRFYDKVGRRKVIKLTRGQVVLFFKTGLEEFENETYIMVRAYQIVLVSR